MILIYEQWRDGILTAHQALRALLSDLRETESEMEPLNWFEG